MSPLTRHFQGHMSLQSVAHKVESLVDTAAVGKMNDGDVRLMILLSILKVDQG